MIWSGRKQLTLETKTPNGMARILKEDLKTIVKQMISLYSPQQRVDLILVIQRQISQGSLSLDSSRSTRLRCLRLTVMESNLRCLTVWESILSAMEDHTTTSTQSRLSIQDVSKHSLRKRETPSQGKLMSSSKRNLWLRLRNKVLRNTKRRDCSLSDSTWTSLRWQANSTWDSSWWSRSFQYWLRVWLMYIVLDPQTQLTILLTTYSREVMNFVRVRVKCKEERVIEIEFGW